MIRFKTYNELTEGKYPLWVKITVGGLVLRMRNLSNRIRTETDPKKQNDLISQQNSILSYISGLGIGFNPKNPTIIKRFKPNLKGSR